MPLITYLGIAAVLSWVISKHSVEETLEYPFAFGAYIAWSIVSTVFITPLALFNMDSADWGTRTKPQEVPLGNTSA